MTINEIGRETVPWLLLALLIASVIRHFGIAPARLPEGGATSAQDVTLHAAPGARVTGDALFSYDSARGQTTITLTLMHLQPGSILRAALRGGSCSAGSTLVQAFPSVQANGHGAARLVAHHDGSFVSRRWALTIQSVPIYLAARTPHLPVGHSLLESEGMREKAMLHTEDYSSLVWRRSQPERKRMVS